MSPADADAFVPAPDDPLLAEHRAVMGCADEALARLDPRGYGPDVDLKTLPGGRPLLDAEPGQAKRYVLAAMLQVRHWDEVRERIRATAQTSMNRMNPHMLPGWPEAWARRQQAQAVATALLKRALPFSREELLVLIDCCSGTEVVYGTPVGSLTRAVERHVAQHGLEPDLRDALRSFAHRLGASYDKDVRRHGTTIERLCADSPGEDAPEPRLSDGPPPSPAPAGSPQVLTELKRRIGAAGDVADSPLTEIGLDRFPLRADSPLRREHEILSDLFLEIVRGDNYYRADLRRGQAGQRVLALPPPARGRVLVAATERHVFALLAGTGDYNDRTLWQSRYAAPGVVEALRATECGFSRDELFDLLLYLGLRPAREQGESARALLPELQREAQTSAFTDGERYVMHLWRASLIGGPPLGSAASEVEQLGRWIGDRARFYLVPGESWTDALNADLARRPGEAQRRWVDLLRHLLGATSARPSAKWSKTAAQLVSAVGAEEVSASLSAWLPLVSRGLGLPRFGSFVGDTRGASDVMHEENANALRGMLWLVPSLPGREELARLTTAVAVSAYRKVPGVGPRAVKVGNAAVYALSQLASPEALGQLAMLKVRVKVGSAQKEIEKAFDAMAAALALPRDEIEEMGIPSYGLEEVGRLEEAIGGYRAELSVTGTEAHLRWSDAGGKALKSVPARVGKEHKEELKELQQSLKDIQSMLPAQRDRIDSLFLAEKTWALGMWRQRYLDHPLVGTIARRLIWRVGDRAVTFLEGTSADVQGARVELDEGAPVRLWHPAGRGTDEVVAWRRRLRELGVTQPFKQAHREIYLLTDAERRTGTYSNRFAAHVLRQHQFNALCAARGWKNKLRLMVDDTFPPASRELPAWGLRAEFWIEGVGTEYGVDTNETGVFLRVASDQVRFYRTGAAPNLAHAGGGGYGTQAQGPGRDDVNEPIPMEQVPPLVFSEIMRDVDLFVGVASVGNDPAWQDGGPGGRYRDYWQSYSFGDLSATALTRREVLQGLVPLLKIAGRCSFEERFLVVRGDQRTYKIHLGSGNILMEPNDQYLCIVPDARARIGESNVVLPFEGDGVLSIILSKALMLAEDTKIKDPTIVRQIRGT